MDAYNTHTIEHNELNDFERICRYIDLKDLIWWIETGTTHLTRVTSWDDPWEYPSSNILEIGNLSKCKPKRIEDTFYAQCWCRNVPDEMGSSPDCDAMWTKYSPNRQGLMIKTTVGKLCQMFKPHFQFATLAPMKYAPEYEIKTEQLFGPPGHMELSVVYIKRDAFRYENEVRYATSELQGVDYVEDIEGKIKDRIFLKVNPRELLDDIITDPRTGDWYLDLVYLYCKRAGFDLKRTCIEKSQLYSSNPFSE